MSADQSLPFDIVAQVVAQAQQATLPALRLTSRDCYGFATSRLYRKVELRARYDSASASVDAVCVGNFLQSILDNHRLGEWMTWLVIARPLDSDLLLSRFAAALRLMPRLQHLDCWGIQAAIQHDASLVEWVAMHAQLRSVFLYLKLDRSCFDPLLDALPCVSALTIRGARHGMRPFRMPALERLLLRSRQSLRSLELDTNYDLDGWEHDISFKNAWPQLKELGLLRMPSLAAARAFVHVEHLRVHEGYRADIPDFLTDSTSFPRLAWLQVCPRAANHALEPARRQLRHLKLTMESVRAIESRRFLNYVATFHWPSLASLHITLVQERWWPLTMDALRRHLPECHGLRYLCYWTDLIPMQEVRLFSPPHPRQAHWAHNRGKTSWDSSLGAAMANA